MKKMILTTIKQDWLFCSFLWLLFHLPFGIDLVIMLIPIMLIIHYVYSKTENTMNGISIPGLYNSPILLLVALWVME